MRNWRGIYVGVALTTLATLLFELSLTRIFSVVFYYHFAFLAISIALFGLGAGGVFSYALAARRSDLYLKLSSLAAAAAVLTIAALGWLLSREDPGGAELGAVYFLSALPFFCAGTLLSLVISETIQRVHRVYFADLLGAAAGCLALVPLLDLVGGPNTVLAAAVVYAGSAHLWSRLSNSRAAQRFTGALAIAVLALLVGNWQGRFLDVRHAKGRDLRLQQERFVKWNSFSRVALAGDVGSGMIYIDADASTGIPAFDFDRLSEADRREALKLGPSLPYWLRPGAKTLVIGAGGGWDVARALASGSRDVTAVEINPIIADTIMRDRFAHYSNNLYRRPEVRVFVEDARTFVRRSAEKYQVIQATLVDTWAATAAGAFALSENNLYTVEAFREYLKHLEDDGLLAFTRWGLEPPRESLRVVSLAAAALATLGGTEPWRHIAVIREGTAAEASGWGALDHILISRRPLADEDLARLRRFVSERGLRLVYLPDERLPGPFTEMLRSTDRRRFFARYPFDVSPVPDNRPFFFYTVQRRDLWRLLNPVAPSSADYQSNRAVPLLFASLAASLAAVAIILILPPLMLRQKMPRQPGIWRLLTYFIFIGAGYIMIQVSLVQKFVLLLGRPTYALTIIIFSMLLSSGLGSYFSRRVAGACGERLSAVLVAITVLVCFLALAQGPVLEAALTWPMILKPALTVLLVAPAGFLMGMPFPIGLSVLEARSPHAVRWAWALNGAASVLGSVAAIALAIHLGMRETLLAGGGMYLAACVASRGARQAQREPAVSAVATGF